MIKGITITLISKTLVGEDDFGCPIYEETREEVREETLKFRVFYL